jgi:two-component system, OmpR family, response regulator
METREKRILIVDDEEMYRWNIADFIEDEGFEVDVAESGETALNMISAQSFDVAIVDMRLPGMDGNAFVTKAKEINANLRFLIHTGSVEYVLPPELKKMGIHQESVFYKPLEDMNLLVVQIKKLLGMT